MFTKNDKIIRTVQQFIHINSRNIVQKKKIAQCFGWFLKL
jgi:hypothetical protein